MMRCCTYRTTGLSLSSSSSPEAEGMSSMSMLSTLRLLIEKSEPLKLPKLPAELSNELRLDIVLSVLSVLALLTVDNMVSTVVSANP